MAKQQSTPIPFSPPFSNISHIMAGAGAGIATSLIVCPLDVVKIRIQGQLPGTSVGNAADWRQMGVLGSLKYILKNEGLPGWYRGLGTTMVTYIPAMAVYFPAYSWAKQAWIRPLSRFSTSIDIYHPAVHMAAAITAGGMTNMVTQPLWLVRTRQMSASTRMTTLNTFRQILSQEGFKALYKGLGPSMLGIFHVIIQFPLYERLKLMQKEHRADPSTPWQIFLASTASKVVASTATYPHEVIRTRLQLQKISTKDVGAKYRGVWHTITTIAREERWRGFYGGLQINIVRVVPAGAITFISYEMILQWLNGR